MVSHNQCKLNGWIFVFVINIFKATVQKPQSIVNMEYNFGENTDQGIVFAKLRKVNHVNTSKGLSEILKKSYLSLNKLKNLSQVQ